MSDPNWDAYEREFDQVRTIAKVLRDERFLSTLENYYPAILAALTHLSVKIDRLMDALDRLDQER